MPKTSPATALCRKNSIARLLDSCQRRSDGCCLRRRSGAGVTVAASVVVPAQAGTQSVIVSPEATLCSTGFRHSPERRQGAFAGTTAGGIRRNDGRGIRRNDGRGIRRNDDRGIRRNDGRGIRRNDGRGIRRNDGRGIRRNDGRGIRRNDGRGIRRNDGRGIRWNDGRGIRRNDGRGIRRNGYWSVLN